MYMIASIAVQLTIDDFKKINFVSILVNASNHKDFNLIPLFVRYFSFTTGLRNIILEFLNLGTWETANIIYNQFIQILINFNLIEKSFVFLPLIQIPILMV